MRIGKIFNQIESKYKSHSFSNIAFNSKKCKKGDIFFAIKGSKKNGNKYINDAISKGAKTIISENKYQG